MRIGLLSAMFAAVAVLAGVDLVSELGEGADSLHWLLEATLFLLGLGGAVTMLRQLGRVTARATTLQGTADDLSEALEARVEEAAALSERLEATEQEATRFREEARAMIRGLADAIDKQLHRWRLTHAEKEVALLLLKGLSHREIASIRGTTDATTRQQARSLYRKAGLKGRNDLAAFFLEDLLVAPESTSDHGV